MRSTLQIKEPHPTATSTYQHTGIGGAGNVRRALPPSSLTEPLKPQSTAPTGRFSTGRGGAGNIPNEGDYRPMFSLDEEAERRLRPAPVIYHTGRGGGGNAVYTRRRSSLESRSSAASAASGSRSGSRSGSNGKERGSLDIAKEWLKKW